MKKTALIFILILSLAFSASAVLADGFYSGQPQQTYPIPQLYPIDLYNSTTQTQPYYNQPYYSQPDNSYQQPYYSQPDNSYQQPYYGPDCYLQQFFYNLNNNQQYYQGQDYTYPQQYYWYDSNNGYQPQYYYYDQYSGIGFYSLENYSGQYNYQTSYPGGYYGKVQTGKPWLPNGSVNLTWTIFNTTGEDWNRSNVDIKCISGCHLLTNPNKTLWDIPYTVNRNGQLSFTVNIWQPMYGESMTFSMVAGAKTLYTFNVDPK
ncbi:MAG: hypothetical protein IKP86_04570 [Anaerolineaceae bacterium]|nr:hypothetical protein [Anaerolineaceae bacterium]